jgi:hypothetical protein
MNGRHGRSAPKGQDPQDVIEEEVTGIARFIEGLRWRLLQNPEALEHPKVCIELQKLVDLIAGPLGYVDRGPGRHRSSDDRVMRRQIENVSGNELKPDPLTTETPVAFIEALWQYRAWSGNPSWRMMADHAGKAVSFSTMYNAMNGDSLPKLYVVKAIIIGCGGNEDDVISFVNGWRRFAIGEVRDRSWPPRQPDE